VRFLGGAGGAPDGALAEHIASASAAGWSALEGVKIDAIACPAWEGGHQDHDAAHLIAQSWARRLGVGVWEYSLYHAHRAGLAPFRVMTLIEEEGEERATTSITWQDRIEGLATLISYPSQWRSMVGLYAPIATIYGLRQEMALRRAPAARVRNRPHAGALLYERRRKYSYAQFERATAAFREAHVLAPAEGA
jgi:LmbE family N-acetylglucosaminyl deacetylase